MPEVVVPTKDPTTGQERTWNEVFPIWNNDDEDTEWRVINQLLETIAINNRMGGKSLKVLKETIRKSQIEFYTRRLDETRPATELDINYKTHPELKDEASIASRAEVLAQRAHVFEYLGKWMYYLDVVFENFDHAYREYKR